jgi:hypothetical protein
MAVAVVMPAAITVVKALSAVEETSAQGATAFMEELFLAEAASSTAHMVLQ